MTCEKEVLLAAQIGKMSHAHHLMGQTPGNPFSLASHRYLHLPAFENRRLQKIRVPYDQISSKLAVLREHLALLTIFEYLFN
jgi:hypothetical protein